VVPLLCLVAEHKVPLLLVCSTFVFSFPDDDDNDELDDVSDDGFDYYQQVLPAQQLPLLGEDFSLLLSGLSDLPKSPYPPQYHHFLFFPFIAVCFLDYFCHFCVFFCDVAMPCIL